MGALFGHKIGFSLSKTVQNSRSIYQDLKIKMSDKTDLDFWIILEKGKSKYVTQMCKCALS